MVYTEIRETKVGSCRPDAVGHPRLDERCSTLMKTLTHLDARGNASMVDVSAKPLSQRTAVASGEIRLHRATIALIQSNQVAKGNVLAAARLAGIMAAKKTGELIPLCHP